jgi:adenosylcobinamide-phosphate synthase
MAGALGIALGGPRRYAGETVQQAHINAAGRHDIDFGDIRAANAVFERACFCLWAAVGLTAFVV